MSANDDYTTQGGEVPVQDDNAPVEEGVDAATADSDAQLGTCSTTTRDTQEISLTVENQSATTTRPLTSPTLSRIAPVVRSPRAAHIASPATVRPSQTSRSRSWGAGTALSRCICTVLAIGYSLVSDESKVLFFHLNQARVIFVGPAHRVNYTRAMNLVTHSANWRLKTCQRREDILNS